MFARDCHGYGRDGLRRHPVKHLTKVPAAAGWIDLRLDRDDLCRHFGHAPRNIGVLLGGAEQATGWMSTWIKLQTYGRVERGFNKLSEHPEALWHELGFKGAATAIDAAEPHLREMMRDGPVRPRP